MSQAHVDTETIVADYDLDEPPHKVWRALTEPALMAAWLGANDIEPIVGHRFRVASAPGAHGPVECEVLEAEPGRRLSYSWREARDGGATLDSEVTWILTPRFDGGTHLRLVHEGFVLSVGRVLALASVNLGLALRHRTFGGLARAFRLAA
jgi:uncharacterized protein YndB with AHSA1/START domain